MLKMFCTNMPIIPPSSSTHNSVAFHYILEVPIKMSSRDGVLSFANKSIKMDTTEIVDPIIRAIENFPNMLVLELKGNTVGVEAGKRLGEAISKHPELQRCLWSDMFTGRLKTEIPSILKSMCSAMMQAHCNIVELDLSDNAFGPIGAEGISDFLTSESAFSLQVLKLNNNGLGAGGKIVAQCLETCYDNALKKGRKFQLKTFVAGRNRLEDPGAIALAKAFKKIGSLEEIIINQNGIRSDGIVAMAEALKYNPNLRVVNFNDNTCTEIGAIAVSEALGNLKALEILDLGDCLCRKGAVKVIEKISEGEHVNIKAVDLSGSELGPSDAEAIISMWRNAFGRDCLLTLSNNCFGSCFLDLYQEVLGSGIEMGAQSEDEGTCDETDDSDSDSEDYDEINSEPDVDSDSDSENDSLDECSNSDEVSDPEPAKVVVNGDKKIISFLDQQLKLNTAEEAEAICSVIDKAQTMHELVLRGNTIGVGAGERLGKSLLRHPELQKCLWSDMFTGRLKTEIPPILKSMCSAMMQAHCNIVELDLSDNAFGPIGAEGISDFLTSESAFSLQVLKLNNNGLGAGGKIVAQCLETCYDNALKKGRKFQLKTFVAGRNRLEDPGAIALAKAFKKIGSLEEIIINQNGIRSKGIVAMAEALKYNPNLRVVNFNDNTCTEIGAIAVSEAVVDLKCLEIIDLGDCLCRKGAVRIIEAVAEGQHISLKKVDLSGSEMGPKDAEAIIYMWKNKFSRLSSLLLSNNCFGSCFLDLSRESLGYNIDLGAQSDDEGTAEESDVEDSSEDSYDEEEYNSSADSESENDEDNDSDVHDLLAGVKSMAVSSFKSISFLDQQLKLNTAEEAEAICSVIDKAQTMHELVLRGNTIGVGAGERLGKSLLRHPELQKCLWSDMFTGRLKTEIPPILKSMCSAMMQAHCNIVELDLSDNAFGPIGAEGISDFLTSESAFSLQVLKLNNNGLGAGGKIVAQCLETCYDNALKKGRKFQLKTFVAGRNRLEDPGAIALAKAFKKIGSLEEIIINQNGIRSDGIVAMAEALKYNPNLRVVNFNDNTCTEIGAIAVSEALGNLKALEILDLGDCLCRKGAVKVIEKISEGEHVNIKAVDLSGSELGPSDAEAIISMWRNAFGRDCILRLSHNCFGSSFLDLHEEVLGSGIDIGAESDDEGSSSD